MSVRILLVGEVLTLTHMVRPAVFAKALHEAGYEAILAFDGRYRDLLGPVPYRTIPLKSAVPAQTSAARIKAGEPIFDAEALDYCVREDLRMLRMLQPDLVVGDMRQSLAVSARIAGVPFVNIINAHWSPYAREDFTPPVGLAHEIFGYDLINSAYKLLFPFGSAIHTFPMNVVRMKYGLRPVEPSIKVMYCEADYTAFADIPEITPTIDAPDTHVYLGPVLWSPSVPEPEWWNDLPSDKPIVYVNLGSSGEPRLLQDVLTALAPLPVTVMAATTKASKLTNVPENVYLADFIAGDEAVRRADFVIGNGGASIAYQALAAGKPSIGLTSNLDQVFFSRIIERTGSGTAIHESRVDAATIRNRAVRMLDDRSYRDKAEELASLIATYDAPTRFLALVERILSRGQGASRALAKR